VILRALNFVVIGVLVLAAAYVYRIKFEATVQAEHLAKLRDEVRHARDKVAALRAEWGQLDDPARIEALVKRFLKLKPVDATQFDDLDQLPDQPPAYMRPGSKDPIGGIIEHLEQPAAVTGSVPAPAAATGDATAPPAERPDEPPALGSFQATPPPALAPAASGVDSR
jgi:hypothetical protein